MERSSLAESESELEVVLLAMYVDTHKEFVSGHWCLYSRNIHKRKNKQIKINRIK